MSDDGLRDDPERGEPDLICPGCEGPIESCTCEDDKATRGGKPEIREHGDLPHRNSGDSSAPRCGGTGMVAYWDGSAYAGEMCRGCIDCEGPDE